MAPYVQLIAVNILVVVLFAMAITLIDTPVLPAVFGAGGAGVLAYVCYRLRHREDAVPIGPTGQRGSDGVNRTHPPGARPCLANEKRHKT